MSSIATNWQFTFDHYLLVRRSCGALVTGKRIGWLHKPCPQSMHGPAIDSRWSVLFSGERGSAAGLHSFSLYHFSATPSNNRIHPSCSSPVPLPPAPPPPPPPPPSTPADAAP